MDGRTDGQTGKIAQVITVTLRLHFAARVNECGANISSGIACETMNFITVALYSVHMDDSYSPE